MRKIKLSRIQGFLRRELKRKLRTDLTSFFIIKEADIECCIYYHLRRFLRSDTRWRVLARKHSTATRHYVDLLIYKRHTDKPHSCQIVIEIKWRPKKLGKKDRGSLRKLLKLGVRKCHFIAALPDASKYESTDKTRDEKNRLFEIVVDLGYRTNHRDQRIDEWRLERKRFRATNVDSARVAAN